jgi:hypothetical protein
MMRTQQFQRNKYKALSTNGTSGNDVFQSNPYPEDFVGIGFDAVDYSNSPLSVFINLQENRGYGPGYSQNDTYVGIARFVLSEHDDIFITRVPTGVVQVTFVDTNSNPFSVPLLDGSIVIVWQCNNGGGAEICAEKHDGNSRRILSQRVINTDTVGIQNLPKGASLPDGRLLVSWEGTDSNAKAKIFFSDLSVSVDEFYITSVAASGGQYGMAVPIILGDGRAVFLIESAAPLPRVSINGTVFDIDTQTRTNFLVSSTNSIGYQQGPSGCALPDGGFVGVWHGNVQGNTFFNIFMQRFDSNITKTGNDVALTNDSNGAQISPFAGDQKFPKIAFNNDKLCVVWECIRQGRTLADICLNVYDLNFALIKALAPLNDYTLNDNRSPYIISLSTGGFRAVWRSYAQGSIFNLINTVLLDNDASKISIESRVNVNPDPLSNNIVRISASSLNGNSFIVSWAGSNNIFYKQYSTKVVVEARGGNDAIVASGMGDTLNCGSGLADILNYTGVSSTCTIDLTTGKGCGDDITSECENIICPKIGCNVTANGGNIIYGAAGNDFVTVMGLPIVVHGNGGNDGISFKFLNSSINITMGVGTAGGSNIMFTDISTIIGSDHKDGDYIVASGTIDGGKGDDTIVAIFPAIIDGGLGVNTVSFELSTKPVTCDLTANIATDGIDTMTLVRIHNIKASPSGGKSTGNTLDNTFYPGAGIDEISGMGGRDKVSYHNSPGPVVVDLTIGRGKNKDKDKDGDARGDTYSGIGDVTGSPYDDVLIGANNRDNTVLDGGAGKDIFTPGNDGLNTVMIGGEDADTFKLGNFQGSATIRDFEINNGEIIDLTGFPNIYSISDLEMSQDVNDNSTIITLSGAEITLDNVDMHSLTSRHFEFTPAPLHKSTINPAWIAFGITAFCAALGGLVTIYRAIMSKEQMTVTKMQRELVERDLSSKLETDAVNPAGSLAKLPASAVDAAEIELA